MKVSTGRESQCSLLQARNTYTPKAGGAEAKENWVSVSFSATANGVGAAASTSYGITLGQNDVVDYDELADDMPPIFIISFEL